MGTPSNDHGAVGCSQPTGTGSMQVPDIQYRLCGIQRDQRGLLQHDTPGTVTTIDIFSKQFTPFPYIS